MGAQAEHYAAGDRHGHAEVGMHENRQLASQTHLNGIPNGDSANGLNGAANGPVAAGDRHGQADVGIHEYKALDGHLLTKSKLSTVDEDA